jgi:hypothetical protein
MAKKNEILLSIALEGDQDVKSKLQAVGEAGKKSLADTEKKIGEAGSRIGKQLAEPLGKVGEALSPLLEEAGFARLGGLLGGGGLFARFSGAAGPAAAVAALSGLALHLAKVSEESERADARLKAFGGGGKALDQLNESAKTLGTSPSSLQGGFEDFLAARRQRQGLDPRIIHPPGYEPTGNEQPLPQVFTGGKLTSGPLATNEEFLAAQRTLLAGSKVDKTPTDQATGAINQLLGSLYQEHSIGTDRFTGQEKTAPGLTAEAVRQFQKTSPDDANRLARVSGNIVGRGFGNADELAAFLDKRDSRGLLSPIAPDKVISSLAKEEPRALQDAKAAHGVTDAFEGLRASAGRLDDAFGKAAGGQVNKALTDTLDTVTGGIGKAADVIERNKGAIEKGATIGRDLGNKTPVPFAGAGGAVIGGLAGGVVGIAGDVAKEVLSTEAAGFLSKALTNPAAIPGNVPAPVGPNQLTPEGLASTKIPSPLDLFRGPAQETAPAPAQPVPPPFLPDRTLDGWPIAPPQQPAPLTPEQTQPVAPPQQFGDIGNAIGDALRGLFQAVTDKASSFAPPQDTKVNGPVDSLGIRGEGPQDTTSNVAELNGAASEATESLKQLASAASSASGSVGSSAPATATVQAAGGGLVQWLDSGGDVAGAGTATSDSIPAMLSDGEYVIKASSARKLGRGMLDHLNAGGGYADGGAVARKLAAVRRKYASGGAVNPSADSPDALPSGSYDVTPTDDGGAIINGVYYGAGAPLLQNPIIQKALQSARAAARDAP